jgi:hypothetical protein
MDLAAPGEGARLLRTATSGLRRTTRCCSAPIAADLKVNDNTAVLQLDVFSGEQRDNSLNP